MKKFRDFLSSPTPQLTEQVVSKVYALSQNAAFSTTRQKLNSVSSNLHTLTQSIKNTDDQNKKVDLLADAIENLNRMLVLQSDLLLSIKNVAIVSVLFADDVKSILKTEIEKQKRVR